MAADQRQPLEPPVGRAGLGTVPSVAGRGAGQARPGAGRSAAPRPVENVDRKSVV